MSPSTSTETGDKRSAEGGESGHGERSPLALSRLLEKLDGALDRLERATPLARATYQTEVFQFAEALIASDGGVRGLYERAHRFDAIGVFSGGAWENPAKLQAPLVAGSLKAGGIYPIVEILSDLRMLAYAMGRAEHEALQKEDAAQFLREVIALNLEYLFPGHTEQERVEGGPQWQAAQRLFRLVSEELRLDDLCEEVVIEIEQICAQRPIMTRRVRRMIELAANLDPPHDAKLRERLDRYLKALQGPSPLSQRHPTIAEYRKALNDWSHSDLAIEAQCFGRALRETGLGSEHHAVLLRHLRKRAPELVADALQLDAHGQAELERSAEFVHQLIQIAILPATSQAIYGLARVLERSLLSRNEVAAGLRRLVDLDLNVEVRRMLLARRRKRDGVSANALLLAGAIAVLGQPLGVGQGRNPTCQAARGISLWSGHAPAYLLELMAHAARDGLIELPFEGQSINSKMLTMGMAAQLDTSLDPVSLLLVPHLDRLYYEIMRRVSLRPEDGHKWANPALYGRWVPNGFASALNKQGTHVIDYEDFVRRFYATHHPAYNDGHELIYPNPVGICVTNAHGELLGPHAVSLQRVAEDPHGELRAYFFNPNNEGRQNWGQGVSPTVSGNGELEGESSLLFYHFASRLYAFHFNPYEEGDAFAVPDETVETVEKLARESWGRAYTWW